MIRYIRLVYNKTKPNELEVIVSGWNHTKEAPEILRDSLYIGYNVLFLTDKDALNLIHVRETKPGEDKALLAGLDK